MTRWFERREDWTKPAGDARTEGDIDYARIVHSGSFRRLQGKTQVLNLGDSDFYRTRLTHSVEVAQLAGGLALQFAQDYADHAVAPQLPDRSMIQAIGFTHDLGHPPFGHGGEHALNYCMREHGGFEGNGQTLRILSKLEKFSASAGANLTRRTLLGVLKYPVPYSRARNPSIKPSLHKAPTTVRLLDRESCRPPKCYMDSEADVVEWILEPLSQADRDQFIDVRPEAGKHNKARHKSLDCSIMDVADDISFGVHDLEDALALRLITQEQFREFVPKDKCEAFLRHLKERHPNRWGENIYDQLVDLLFSEGAERKHQISQIVGYLVGSARIVENEAFDEPLLRFRAELGSDAAEFLAALHELERAAVISSPSVQHLEAKGQGLVVAVFETIATEPGSFLARDAQQRFRDSRDPFRVICDEIAGMTDTFLLRTYNRLFSPGLGSVFDKL